MNPTEALKKNYVACKLSFSWWGQRRRMEDSIKKRMVEPVQAKPDSVYISKQLYNADLPPLKVVNKIKGKIRRTWEDASNPSAEDGVRYLPRVSLKEFQEKMDGCQAELQAASMAVQQARAQILDDARNRLQDAFNEQNYPADLATLFSFELSYPKLEPAQGLPAAIAKQQQELAAAKLAEAVQLTTQAHAEALAKLVAHLKDKLTPNQDGTKKIFRDNTVNELQEFFTHFAHLNIGSCEDLDQIVAQAKALVSGVTAGELRNADSLRSEVAAGLAEIGAKLAPLVQTAPRRKILPIEPNGGQQPCVNGSNNCDSPASSSNSSGPVALPAPTTS